MNHSTSGNIISHEYGPPPPYHLLFLIHNVHTNQFKNKGRNNFGKLHIVENDCRLTDVRVDSLGSGKYDMRTSFDKCPVRQQA